MDNDTTRRRRRRGWRARGAAAPEYAIVLSLFAVVIIASLGSLEDTARDEFANDADCVGQRPPPTTCQLSYLETTTTALGGGGGSSTTAVVETTTTTAPPPTTTTTTTTTPPATTSSVPGTTTTAPPPPPDAIPASGEFDNLQRGTPGNNWWASLRARIEVPGPDPVGATVTVRITYYELRNGSWIAEGSYERTCTTDSNGNCRVASNSHSQWSVDGFLFEIISVEGGTPPAYLQSGDSEWVSRFNG